MPTISMFYGILMKMYREQGGKHKGPHVHAEYADYEAVFDFDGNLLEGELPRKQRKYVEAWILLHEEELHANWKLLQNGEPFFKIRPLQ